MKLCAVLSSAFCLALVFPLHAAGSRCATGDEQPLLAPPPAHSEVAITLVDPPNGGAVDADTVVGLEVEFRIADFEPGKFSLRAAFPALVSLSSPSGDHGVHVIQHPAGRVRLCVPLREMYETSRVRWPLQVIVVAAKETGRFEGTPHYEHVARSAPLTLNAVRPSTETVRMQVAAVSEEYQEAVTALSHTVGRMQALASACRRLPEPQVEFDAAYQGWASRNATLIDRIQKLRRDLLERDMGRADVVEQVMEMNARAARVEFDVQDDELRAICRNYVRAFSNPRSDLETAGAAQLTVIQQQAPAKLPGS